MTQDTKADLSVLLIEDNPVDAALVGKILKKADMRVRLSVASTLTDGLAHIDNAAFDVLLLDLHLPDSHGEETLTRIREHEPRIPVVVLTGNDDDQLAVQLVRWGAQDYLVKGRCDHRTFLRTIRYAIERQRLIEELDDVRKELSIREASYRNIITNSMYAIVIVSTDRIIRFVNPAAAALYGTDIANLPGRPFELPIRIGEMLDITIPRTIQPPIMAKMHMVDILWNGEAAYLATFDDITERTRARNELKESELRFKTLAQSINDAVISADASGNIIFWNNGATRTFGYLEAEVLGRSMTCLLPARCRAKHQREWREVREQDQPELVGKTVELEGLDKNGHEFPLELSPSSWEIQGRRYFTGIFRDVTERHKAVRELRENGLRFRMLSESLPIGLFEADAYGRCIYTNNAWQTLFGVSFADSIGASWKKWIHPNFRDEVWDEWADARRDLSRYERKFQVQPQSGASLWVHFIASAMMYDDGIRFIGTVTDITDNMAAEIDRNNLEITLRHSQKMEAIGQLAAGIAHEINTPVQFIGDHTWFLLDAFGDIMKVVEKCESLAAACKKGGIHTELIAEIDAACEESDLEYLKAAVPTSVKQSLEGVDRVATIVRAMKEFSHPGVDDKTAIDLNHAIQNTIDVARNEWKYVADVTTQFDADLPIVECKVSEVNQVILNMIVNAAHAIEDKSKHNGNDTLGSIHITTRGLESVVEVRIRDSGTGIPDELRSRIFDPFFTSKEVGKGTGQGLAISHNVIVNKHGGSIDVETEPGVGTTFVIRLPVKAASSAVAVQNAEASAE